MLSKKAGVNFLWFVCTVLIVPLTVHAQKLSVHSCLTEYQQNPEAIECPNPRFSWQLASDIRNTIQKGYEIRVSRSERFSGKDLIWKDMRAADDQSVNIVYKGPQLESGVKYYWQVRVTDKHGNYSGWSRPQYWRMGLSRDDWKAQWISTTGKDTSSASPVFRKRLSLAKSVKAARLYITSRGLYEAFMNGKRIGDCYFTPGWTSYNKRLQYQVYDVKTLLGAENVLMVTLGDGWYKGYTGIDKRNVYGDTRALLAQLEIEYADGTSHLICTDTSWQTRYGGILSSDIYHGEIYDARRQKKEWSSPDDMQDAQWAPVRLLPFGTEKLVSTTAPPVRKQQRLKAQKIFTTPKGELVADFGQNLVGWVNLTAKGMPGTKITLSHAEVLDQAGNFYVHNLRRAKQQNTYYLSGDDVEELEPHFSFQGFRYVKIEGYPGTLRPDDLTAVALYSDMPVTGTFVTSNPLISKLQQNIDRSQRGNFLDVPTDCPQRDERLGWTGDALVFYNTAAYNMGVAGFFTKWLRDLAADQQSDGNVPFVIPNVLGEQGWAGSAGWGDVAVVVPWDMYTTYGDVRILEEQYPSMKAWLNYVTSVSRNHLWNSGHHFGDWLFYRPDDDVHGRAAVTDKHLIAQIFYANSAEVMMRTAALLKIEADEAYFKQLVKDIKKAFLKEYVSPGGRLSSNTQTAYVLALQFDMLPEEMRAAAAERLVHNVRSYGNHLTTGFLGTPYLCHVLTKFGYTNVAYDLLLQESYPSWLYPVKKGATTIWERWDGIKEDGSFQNSEMNSFNHYAYGAIGDWMYKNIAGIATDAGSPGYKKIRISPKPGGNISTAAGSFKSAYGLIESSWKITRGRLQLEVTIPPNTSATIVLPAAAGKAVFEGKNPIPNNQLTRSKQSSKDLQVEVGSGSYSFAYMYEGL